MPPLPRRITLHSPLSPAECRERIGAEMDPRGTLFGRKPLIGRFDGDDLSARKRIGYRNSFQETVRVRFVPRAGGTDLDCQFAMSALVGVFMTLWLGLVGFGALTVWLSLGRAVFNHGRSALHGMGPAAIIPPVMFAGGLALLFGGRFIAGRERRAVAGLLARTTLASDGR